MILLSVSVNLLGIRIIRFHRLGAHLNLAHLLFCNIDNILSSFRLASWLDAINVQEIHTHCISISNMNCIIFQLVKHGSNRLLNTFHYIVSRVCDKPYNEQLELTSNVLKVSKFYLDMRLFILIVTSSLDHITSASETYHITTLWSYPSLLRYNTIN